jgi:hypothetical protein
MRHTSRRNGKTGAASLRSPPPSKVCLGVSTMKTCHAAQRNAETACTFEATPLMVTDSRTSDISSTVWPKQIGHAIGVSAFTMRRCYSRVFRASSND